MDEQIKNHLLEYLDKTAGAVEKLVDFSADQIPLVAQEIITYYRFSSGIYLFIGLISAYTCITKAVSLHTNEVARIDRIDAEKGRNRPSISDYYSDKVMCFLLVLGVITLISTLTIFHDLDIFVKSVVAPRLFILDYIRGLK